MPARKRLHRQVNPLMPLQIMIAIEALRALVALERPVVLRRLLPVHVPAQLVRWVLQLHVAAADERHLRAGVVDVGHDGAGHGRHGVAAVQAWLEGLRRRLHGVR